MSDYTYNEIDMMGQEDIWNTFSRLKANPIPRMSSTTFFPVASTTSTTTATTEAPIATMFGSINNVIDYLEEHKYMLCLVASIVIVILLIIIYLIKGNSIKNAFLKKRKLKLIRFRRNNKEKDLAFKNEEEEVKIFMD